MPIKPKLERKWGQPHRIIESISEIASKEAAFVKSGEEFVHVSKNRTESSVTRDPEKYFEFLKKHKGKFIIDAHTHPISTRQLPSPGDITSYFMEFLYDHISNNKNLNNIIKEDLRFIRPKVIFVVDKDGKDIGRVHFHLTLKTVNLLKEGVYRFNVETKNAIEQNISQKIQFLTRKEILRIERERNGRPLTNDNKYIVNLHATKYYFEKVLGINMHFNAMPGYKFNKEKLQFEEI